MKITIYLHSCKESNWETGEEAGLSEEALKIFIGALYEVEFDLDVKENGEYEIIEIREGSKKFRGPSTQPQEPPLEQIDP